MRRKKMQLILMGIFKSFWKKKLHGNTSYPIDFVVTWVNGNDVAWQEERARIIGEKGIRSNGNGVCRYRDWVSFKYWFRAVEKFAPWVRCVHLVTWGHVPEWLNTESPKLKIVNHKDYMPNEFLPTYNSNALELNLFRIQNLSEHFVYFNDDVLLVRDVKPEDFFQNGKPVHTAVAFPCINRDNELPYHMFFNTYGMINRKNRIADCIEKYPEKWFSHIYGRQMGYNVRAWQDDGISGIYFTHMAAPFCRSSMEKVWKKYEKTMIETCKYKVRDIHQITHQIFSIEDILNGNFEPEKDDWGYCVRIEDIDQIEIVYRNKSKKMICLFDRDNMSASEIVSINEQLTKLYERIFPKKSLFEK